MFEDWQNYHDYNASFILSRNVHKEFDKKLDESFQIKSSHFKCSILIRKNCVIIETRHRELHILMLLFISAVCTLGYSLTYAHLIIMLVHFFSFFHMYYLVCDLLFILIGGHYFTFILLTIMKIVDLCITMKPKLTGAALQELIRNKIIAFDNNQNIVVL